MPSGSAWELPVSPKIATIMSWPSRKGADHDLQVMIGEKGLEGDGVED